MRSLEPLTSLKIAEDRARRVHRLADRFPASSPRRRHTAPWSVRVGTALAVAVALALGTARAQEPARPMLSLQGSNPGEFEAFSPDNAMVLTRTRSSVLVWDAETGALLRSFSDEYDIEGAAFSPDGRALLTWSVQPILWDVRGGTVLQRFEGVSVAPPSMGISFGGLPFAAFLGREGLAVAVGKSDFDGTGYAHTPALVVWDAFTGDVVHRIRLGDESARATAEGGALSADGRRVLVWQDHRATVWDTDTGELVLAVAIDGGGFGRPDPALAADGSRVATVDGEGWIEVWDVDSGTRLHRFRTHHVPESPVPYSVAALALSPDGGSLATTGWDFTMKVWEVPDGREVYSVRDCDPAELEEGRMCLPFTSAAFTPDGTRVITTVRGRNAMGWDARDGTPLGPWQSEGARALARLGLPAYAPERAFFSGSGAHVVVESTTESRAVALVWSVEEGRLVQAIPRASDGFFNRSSTVLGPSGERLAVPRDSAGLDLWAFESSERVRALVPPSETASVSFGTAEPLRVRFSRDGAFLLTSDARAAVRVWDVAEGRLAQTLRSRTGETLAIDGVLFDAMDLMDPEDMLAGGIRDDSLLARDLVRVQDAAFSPDGRLVATARADSTVQAFNRASGSLAADLRGLGGQATRVEFSPDGSRLAAWTGRLHVWRTDTWDDVTPPDLQEGGFWVAMTLAPDWSAVHLSGLNGGYATFGLPAPPAFAAPDPPADGGPPDLDWDSATVPVISPGGTYTATHAAGAAHLVVWPSAAPGRAVRLEGHRDRVLSAAFGPDAAVLVSTSEDGTARLWDPETGDELAALTAFVDGSWLVTTPDGRFDAPDLEAIDGAVWIAPDDPLTPLPVEAFMREFYEPRLLPRLLEGETFPDIGSLLDKNRVQPAVEIAAAEPTGDGTARITVRARGTERTYGGEARTSGVRDLRLFRGGQLVGWADGALLPETGEWERTFEVPLASGADTVAFSAYAFNRDLVKSRTARATLAVPAAAAPRRPRRAFVVSLGVDAFADPAWDLAFAAADARAYASALDSTLSASGDYDAVVAVALVSAHAEAANTDATAAALRGALLRLAGEPLDADAEAALARVPGADRLAEATPDDVVVVTASTHGYASPEGVFYLLPQDVPVVPRGQALETPAFLEAAVSSDELSAWLRGVDAGARAVVVDACNAAGAVEGSGFKPGPMGARGLGQLAFDKGASVLTATQADAPALEAAATKRGLLTFALVENGLLAGQADGALSVGASGDSPDGRITLDEWLAYGTARVPMLYEEVRAGEVETYGRGSVRARSLPPDLAVGAENAAAGAQTPALFDFRKGARDVVLADG